MNNGDNSGAFIPTSVILAGHSSLHDVLQFTRHFIIFDALKNVTGSSSESSLPDILIAFLLPSVKNEEIKQATARNEFSTFLFEFLAPNADTHALPYLNAASV